MFGPATVREFSARERYYAPEALHTLLQFARGCHTGPPIATVAAREILFEYIEFEELREQKLQRQLEYVRSIKKTTVRRPKDIP
jgi:hypothetical protein